MASNSNQGFAAVVSAVERLRDATFSTSERRSAIQRPWFREEQEQTKVLRQISGKLDKSRPSRPESDDKQGTKTREAKSTTTRRTSGAVVKGNLAGQNNWLGSQELDRLRVTIRSAIKEGLEDYNRRLPGSSPARTERDRDSKGRFISDDSARRRQQAQGQPRDASGRFLSAKSIQESLNQSIKDLQLSIATVNVQASNVTIDGQLKDGLAPDPDKQAKAIARELRGVTLKTKIELGAIDLIKAGFFGGIGSRVGSDLMGGVQKSLKSNTGIDAQTVGKAGADLGIGTVKNAADIIVAPEDSYRAAVGSFAKATEDAGLRSKVPLWSSNAKRIILGELDPRQEEKAEKAFQQRVAQLEARQQKEASLPEAVQKRIQAQRKKKGTWGPEQALEYIKFMESERPDMLARYKKSLIAIGRKDAEQRTAIRYYTEDMGYREMNRTLRGTIGKKEVGFFRSKGVNRTLDQFKDDAVKTTNAAVAGLNALPSYKGTVYRGLDLPQEIIDQIKPGGVWNEPALMSTTKNSFQRYPGNVLFEVKSKQGGKDISSFEAFDNQEVLFAPNSNFRITSKRKIKRLGHEMWVVQLEDLNEAIAPEVEAPPAVEIERDTRKSTVPTKAKQQQTTQPATAEQSKPLLAGDERERRRRKRGTTTDFVQPLDVGQKTGIEPSRPRPRQIPIEVPPEVIPIVEVVEPPRPRNIPIEVPPEPPRQIPIDWQDPPPPETEQEKAARTARERIAIAKQKEAQRAEAQAQLAAVIAEQDYQIQMLKEDYLRYLFLLVRRSQNMAMSDIEDRFPGFTRMPASQKGIIADQEYRRIERGMEPFRGAIASGNFVAAMQEAEQLLPQIEQARRMDAMAGRVGTLSEIRNRDLDALKTELLMGGSGADQAQVGVVNALNLNTQAIAELVQVLRTQLARRLQPSDLPADAAARNLGITDTRRPPSPVPTVPMPEAPLSERFDAYILSVIEEAKAAAEQQVELLMSGFRNLSTEGKKDFARSFLVDLRSRAAEFREAMAAGQTDLALEIGESILRQTQSVRQIYDTILSDPSSQNMGRKSIQGSKGFLTQLEQEVIGGQPNMKGRSPEGLIQGLARAEEAAESGDATAQGFLNALERRIDEAIGLGGDIGRGTLDGLDDALGIQSPSEEMRKRGQMAGEGFKIGAVESLRDAGAAIQAEVERIKATILQDIEYLRAVATGDTAKAQAMVEQAAKGAGYNVGPVYHGSEKAGWTEPDLSLGAFYAASDPAVSQTYVSGKYDADPAYIPGSIPLSKIEDLLDLWQESKSGRDYEKLYYVPGDNGREYGPYYTKKDAEKDFDFEEDENFEDYAQYKCYDNGENVFWGSPKDVYADLNSAMAVPGVYRGLLKAGDFDIVEGRGANWNKIDLHKTGGEDDFVSTRDIEKSVEIGAIIKNIYDDGGRGRKDAPLADVYISKKHGRFKTDAPFVSTNEGVPVPLSARFDDSVADIRGNVNDLFAGLKSQAGDALQPLIAELETAFASAGDNSIESLIASLEGALDGLRQTGVDIGDTLAGGVQDGLGIQSPSKVFKAIGEHIIAGLEQGLEGFEGTLEEKRQLLETYVKSIIETVYDFKKVTDRPRQSVEKVRHLFQEIGASGEASPRQLRQAEKFFPQVAPIDPESPAAASYSIGKNTIKLRPGREPAKLIGDIVHEYTHALQDNFGQRGFNRRNPTSTLQTGSTSQSGREHTGDRQVAKGASKSASHVLGKLGLDASQGSAYWDRYSLLMEAETEAYANEKGITGKYEKRGFLLADAESVAENIKAMRKAAKDSVQGLADGVNEQLDQVKQSGLGIGQALQDGVKDSLDIQSPSQRMAEIGRNSIEGFANGVEEGRQRLFSVINGILDFLENIPIVGNLIKLGRTAVAAITSFFGKDGQASQPQPSTRIGTAPQQTERPSSTTQTTRATTARTQTQTPSKKVEPKADYSIWDSPEAPKPEPMGKTSFAAWGEAIDPKKQADRYLAYLTQWLDGIRSSFKAGLDAELSELRDSGADIAQAIRGQIDSLNDGLDQKKAQFRQAIADGNTALSQALGLELLEQAEQVKVLYQSMANEVETGPGKKLWSGKAGEATKLRNEVVRGQPNMKGRAPTGLWQAIGASVDDGFSQGIETDLNQAERSGMDLGEAAIAGAKKALGIKSPSEEFFEIGLAVIEGFDEALDALGEGTANNVRKFLHDVDSGAQDAVDNLRKGMTDLIGELNERFPAIGQLAKVALGIFVALGLEEVIRNAVGAFAQLASASFQAVIGFESLNLAFISLTGSSSRAAEQIQYVSGVAKELGVDLHAAEEAYLGFVATARGTALEGVETDRMFRSFAATASARGLNADETSRMFLALEQMMGKSVVQAEEVRGQLGQFAALDFKGTMARALGISVPQLMDEMSAGGMMAADVLPKVAAQYAAENAVVSNAPETTATAITRYNNAILEMQRSMGDWFVGVKEAIEVATWAVEEFTKAIPALIKVVTALAAILAWNSVSIVGALLKIPIVAKLAGMALSGLQKIIGTILSGPGLRLLGTYIAQILLIEVAFTAWSEVLDIVNGRFTEYTKAIETATKAAEEHERAIAKLNNTQDKTSPLPTNPGDIITDQTVKLFGIDTNFNLDWVRQRVGIREDDSLMSKAARTAMFGPLAWLSGSTRGEQEMYDFVIQTGGTVLKGDNTVMALNDEKKRIEEVLKIEQQLNEVRSRRTQNIRGDREAYEKSVEEEKKLLAQREKLVEVTAAYGERLTRDITAVEQGLADLDAMVARGGITADYEASQRAALEDRLKALKDTQRSYEDLVNSLQKSLSHLEREIRNLNEAMVAFNEATQRATTNQRIAFLRQARESGTGSVVRGIGLEQIAQSELDQRIQFTQGRLGSQRNLLADPVYAAAYRELQQQAAAQGVMLENTATLDRIISEQEGTQYARVAQLLKEILETQDQLAQYQEQAAQSVIDLDESLFGLNRQIADFFQSLTQQVNEVQTELQRATLRLRNSQIQQRLRRILAPGADGFINSFVGHIQGLFDQANSLMDSILGQRSNRFQFTVDKYSLENQMEDFRRSVAGATDALNGFTGALGGQVPAGNNAVATNRNQQRAGQQAAGPLNTTQMFFPVVTGRIGTSPGQRFNAPRDGGRRRHDGIDIEARPGEPVHAVVGGTIRELTMWDRRVNSHKIVVVGSDGVRYVYGHVVPRSGLKVGDVIRNGEQFATISEKDRLSSGPHLHFEAWRNGQKYDPTSQIQNLPRPTAANLQAAATAASNQQQSGGTPRPATITRPANIQSYVVQDVASGQVISSANSTTPPASPASTIKVLIADLVADAVNKGQLSLAQALTVRAQEVATGSTLQANQTRTVQQLLTAMLKDSDNTSTNVLINALGGTGNVTQRLRAMGYSGTTIGNLLSIPGATGFRNVSTAQDVTRATQRLLTRGGPVDRVSANALRQTRNFGFSGEQGGKIGNNSRVMGNVGIVNIGGKEYLVTAYANVDGNNTNNRGIIRNFTNQVSSALSQSRPPAQQQQAQRQAPAQQQTQARRVPQLSAGDRRELLQMMMAEAEGEGVKGMAAVGRSILNRWALTTSGVAPLGTGGYGIPDKTLGGLLRAKTPGGAWQYSPLGDGRFTRQYSQAVQAQAEQAFNLLLDDAGLRALGLSDAVLSSPNFQHRNLGVPGWWHGGAQRVGNHNFARDKFSINRNMSQLVAQQIPATTTQVTTAQPAATTSTTTSAANDPIIQRAQRITNTLIQLKELLVNIGDQQIAQEIGEYLENIERGMQTINLERDEELLSQAERTMADRNALAQLWDKYTGDNPYKEMTAMDRELQNDVFGLHANIYRQMQQYKANIESIDRAMQFSGDGVFANLTDLERQMFEPLLRELGTINAETLAPVRQVYVDRMEELRAIYDQLDPIQQQAQRFNQQRQALSENTQAQGIEQLRQTVAEGSRDLEAIRDSAINNIKLQFEAAKIQVEMEFTLPPDAPQEIQDSYNAQLKERIKLLEQKRDLDIKDAEMQYESGLRQRQLQVIQEQILDAEYKGNDARVLQLKQQQAALEFKEEEAQITRDILDMSERRLRLDQAGEKYWRTINQSFVEFTNNQIARSEKVAEMNDRFRENQAQLERNPYRSATMRESLAMDQATREFGQRRQEIQQDPTLSPQEKDFQIAKEYEILQQRLQLIDREFLDLTETIGMGVAGAFNSFFQALINGENALQAFGQSLLNAIAEIGSQLITAGVNNLIGGLFGFATGGYTGPGGKYEPAGIVHAGEYVINKEATSKLGLPLLNALNAGKPPGYYTGGLVAPFSAESNLLSGLNSIDRRITLSDGLMDRTRTATNDNRTNIKIEQNFHAPVDRFNKSATTLAREQAEAMRRAMR